MSTRIPPISVLLTFPPPNYDQPVTHGRSLLIVNLLFFALATIVLGLRLYSKAFIRKKLGPDDLFICIGYVIVIGAHIVVNYGVLTLGWDRHVWDVKPEWIKGSLKNVYAGEVLLMAAGYFTVNSLLYFYYHINKDIGDREAAVRWFTWAIYLAIILNSLLFIPFFILVIFQCYPISLFWTFPAPPDVHCIDPKVVIFGGGITKLFMDAVTSTLPIALIVNLHLSHAQKYSSICLIALGYIVCAAGAMRCYYTYMMIWKSYDLTWLSYYVYVASVIESDLAIICASAPIVRPLLQKIFSKPKSITSVSTFNSQVTV